MRRTVLQAVLRTIVVLLAMVGGRAAAAERPNVVLFLVDDLGWADVSPNNPDTFYETPNVQRLADEGANFTNGYAANPVCSPTRYSVMTGRYPSRADLTNWLWGKRKVRFRGAEMIGRLPAGDRTVAEFLRDAGYRTAFLGKWHLGEDEAAWPEHNGFDVNRGGHSKGHPPSYFSPYRNPRLSDGPEGEYLTDRLAEEAARLVDEYAVAGKADGQSFFLDLSFYSVHTPLQAPQPLVQKYRQKAERLGLDPAGTFATEEQVYDPAKYGKRRVRTVQSHPTYAAMVESMDAAVGRVLEALDRNGVAGETLVIFTSDNGGLSTSEGSPTSNLPLRGGKGWMYEGGIREPFLIRWPGVAEAGATIETPVMTTDILPTVCEAAGVSMTGAAADGAAADGAEADDDQANGAAVIDGLSLRPLLQGEGLPERDLFWHYPHYGNQGGFPAAAVRRGDLKLIERLEDGRTHLYDLAADAGERADLSEQRPREAAELREVLHQWYADVDANLLRPMPDGPPAWRPKGYHGGTLSAAK